MNSYTLPRLRTAGLAGAALLATGSVGLALGGDNNPATENTTTAQELTSTLNCEKVVIDEGEDQFLVSVDGKLGPTSETQFNVVIVIDISTTMGQSDLLVGSIGDLNGDGSADERLDAAILGVQLLAGQIGAGSNVDVALVAFAKDSAIMDLGPAPGQQTWLNDLTTDADTSGVADFTEVVTSFDTGGLAVQNVGKFTTHNWEPGTDYTEALIRAQEALALQPAGETNIIYFISDGLPNQNDIQPTFNQPGGVTEQLAAAGVVINSIGIESLQFTGICDPGSPLLYIADETGGTCLAVEDPNEIDETIGNAGTTDIDRIELCVNGNLIATVDGPGIDEDECKVLSLPDTDIFGDMTLGPNLVEGKVYALDGTVATASKVVDKTACLLLVGLTPTNSQVDGIDFRYVNPLMWFNVTEDEVPTFTIPNVPALAGTQIYMQVGMHNGPMFPNNPIQMSNGVRVVIGDQWNVYGSATGIWHWVDGGINPGESFLPKFDVLAM